VHVTVVSAAGWERAADPEAPWTGHGPAPADAPRALERFLARPPVAALNLGPALRPATADALARRGIPWPWLVARFHERAWRPARRVPCLYRPPLAAPATILAGDEATRTGMGRFLPDPAPPVTVTGSPLLEAPDAPDRRAARELRGALGGRPVLAFPDTEPGEEELLTGVCRHIPAPFTHWLMAVMPADPARGPYLAEHLAGFGLTTALASRGDALTPATAVYILDDAGQAPLFQAAADMVVLGGTWVQGPGGADPRPAAAAGRGILAGPYGHRHREAVEALEEAGAVHRTPNVNNLLAGIRQWLQHPGAADAAGRAGRELVAAHRGATQRIVTALDRHLPVD
jgi:3-deoxy-D-manno-octulosonic-acid transferase